MSADCTLKKSSSKCEVLHDRNGNSEGALEAFSVKGWYRDIPLPWKFFSKLQLHGVKGFGISDGFRSSFLVLGWLLRSPCCYSQLCWRLAHYQIYQGIDQDKKITLLWAIYCYFNQITSLICVRLMAPDAVFHTVCGAVRCPETEV